MDDGKLNGLSQIAEQKYQRVVNGWAMYDWANSGFAVVILTAIFPVYYRALAMDAGAAPETATAYWAYTTSLSLLLVAAIGPVAGAAADLLGAKKRFLALAIMVGVVQGGTQALSRSLFAAMVPRTHSAEFFGFFSTGEKVAGIIGPALFGLVGQLTGSSRWGIVSITLLFAAGALLLRRVDVAEGRRVAALVEASA